MDERKESEIGYREVKSCANCKHSTPKLFFWDSGQDCVTCGKHNEKVWIAAICDYYEEAEYEDQDFPSELITSQRSFNLTHPHTNETGELQ